MWLAKRLLDYRPWWKKKVEQKKVGVLQPIFDNVWIIWRKDDWRKSLSVIWVSSMIRSQLESVLVIDSEIWDRSFVVLKDWKVLSFSRAFKENYWIEGNPIWEDLHLANISLPKFAINDAWWRRSIDKLLSWEYYIADTQISIWGDLVPIEITVWWIRDAIVDWIRVEWVTIIELENKIREWIGVEERSMLEWLMQPEEPEDQEAQPVILQTDYIPTLQERELIRYSETLHTVKHIFNWIEGHLNKLVLQENDESMNDKIKDLLEMVKALYSKALQFLDDTRMILTNKNKTWYSDSLMQEAQDLLNDLGIVVNKEKNRMTEIFWTTIDSAKIVEKALVEVIWHIEQFWKEPLDRVFKLESIVKSVASLHSWKENGIIVEVDMSGVWELAYVKWDDLSLSNILHNLVTNAINHSPKSGIVRIKVVSTDKGDIEFCVSDQWDWIAKEKQAGIFWVFKQNRSWTNNESTTWSWLWLYTVRQLVEIHKGKVWIESELWEWANFKFTYSLTEKPWYYWEEEMYDNLYDWLTLNLVKKKSDFRVLIAEDDATNRAVIKGLLRGYGYTLVTSDNVTESVEETNNKPFHFTIMDNEFAFKEWGEKGSPWWAILTWAVKYKVPWAFVYAYSANSNDPNDSTTMQYARSGADWFFSKWVTQEELFEALDRAYESFLEAE